MAAKIVSLVFLALVAQAYTQNDVTLIELEDQTVNIIANDFIGRSITIPKFFLDSLESCHIIFPNGITYEAFPNSNIPQETIFFADTVATFRACAVGFRGISVDDAGTYELLSMVKHSDNSDSLTRQRFHLNVVQSEVKSQSHCSPECYEYMTIEKFILGSLESCNIIFPTRILQETIFFAYAVATFRAISVDDAGTYELLSMVKHSDNSKSLMRQRFHLNVVQS